MKKYSAGHLMKTICLFAFAALLVAADQIVKFAVADNIEYVRGEVSVIDGFFSLVHWHNDGGMWGLFPGKVVYLAYIASAVGLIMLFFAIYIRDFLPQLSVFMIIAGAVGNVIDRFRLGYVIDFLSFNFWGYQYPAFNIADSCVTVGIFILLIFSKRIFNVLDPKQQEEVVNPDIENTNK